MLFTGWGLPRSCSGSLDGSGGGRDEEAVQSASPSPNRADPGQKIAPGLSGLRGRGVWGRVGCSGAAQRGLTYLLFVVGGEQLALVARSRLGLLLLWLLAGEGTADYHLSLIHI